MDNDAIVVEEMRDTLFSDDCGNYNYLVTIAATDSCGNTTTIQFNIVVQDTDEPYLFWETSRMTPRYRAQKNGLNSRHPRVR